MLVFGFGGGGEGKPVLLPGQVRLVLHKGRAGSSLYTKHSTLCNSALYIALHYLVKYQVGFTHASQFLDPASRIVGQSQCAVVDMIWYRVSYPIFSAPCYHSNHM